MINNQGALYFGAGIDMTQWRQNVNEMRRDILGLSQNTAQQTKQMDTSFRNLGMGLATYFSGAALGNFANQIINVRGEFQKTEIAFGTMLKSTDKAKELMGQMVELAAKTPFSLQDVSAGAKQLLAFQVPADQVVDTLTRMGNIAAGLGVPLSRINLVYGQVMAKGKLMGDDLRQFTEAGIPMVAELAKKFNTSTSAITEMVSAGKIGFKDVQDVLFSLTNEGGMFFNLMEKQSKSLSGQVANLGDAWDQMLNKIGESNQGFLSGTIKEVTFAIENYESLIEIIKGLILTYGAYKAAIMLTAAAQSVARASAIQLTTTEIAAGVAKRTLTGIQATLNATILANPYALAAAAIAGLIYAIYKLNTQVTTAQEIQTEFSGILQNHNNKVGETKAKIDALVTAIKSNNTTDEKRKVLTNQLNTLTDSKIDGLTAERVRTGQLDAQIKAFIQTLYQQADAMSYVDQLNSLYAKKRNNEELKNRAKSGDTTIGEYFGAMFDKDTYKNNGGEIGLSAKELISARADEENKAIDAAISRTKKEIEKRGNIIADAQTDAGAKIAEGTNTATEETKKAVKKQNDEVEKIYGENTIKGLQQRIQKFQEIMETSADGSESFNNAKSQKTALEALLKEITSSFEEQLSEIERQWENYYKLSEFYGKEVADAQYKDLINGSNSYLAYLEKEQEALKNKTGILSDEDKKALIFLTEKINGLTGAKTPLQNWKDDINEALRGVVSLTEQLKILEQKEEEIFASEGGNTSNFLAFKRENDAQKDNIIQQQKDQFNQLLEEQRSYEEKSLALQEEYDTMRALAKTDAERKKVDDAYSKKFTDLFFEQMQNSDTWVRMFSEMQSVATNELEEFRKILIEKLKNAKTDAEKIRIGDFIAKIDNEIKLRNPFISLNNSLKKLIEKIKEGSATAGDFIAVLSDLSAVKSEINGLIDQFQEVSDALGLNIDTSGAKETFNNIIGGIEGIGQAVNGFLSGNPLEIAKGVMKAFASIGKLFNKDAKKEREIKRQAAYLKELETAYNNLAFAAERAFGAQKYDGQRELIKNLQQQKAIILEMLRIEQSKKKADKEKVAQYNSQIQQINQSIDELKEGIIKDVLQTDIPDMAAKMGDAIFQAFEQGASGIDAINNAFNDLIKNMLKNQLNKILEKQMEGLMPNILKAMGFDKDGNGTFNGLTQAEIDALRAQMQAATAQGQQFIDAYAQIFEGLGINGLDAQGLKGDIKGVTEKTAGALESQINAMRINQVLHLEAVRNSLLELHQIELNTRNLHQMRKDLAELNYKTKNQLAGVP